MKNPTRIYAQKRICNNGYARYHFRDSSVFIVYANAMHTMSYEISIYPASCYFVFDICISFHLVTTLSVCRCNNKSYKRSINIPFVLNTIKYSCSNVLWSVMPVHCNNICCRSLTHRALVMPYRGLELAQHWLRQWLIAWWQQAITWSDVDLPSARANRQSLILTWISLYDQISPSNPTRANRLTLPL